MPSSRLIRPRHKRILLKRSLITSTTSPLVTNDVATENDNVTSRHAFSEHITVTEYVDWHQSGFITTRIQFYYIDHMTHGRERIELYIFLLLKKNMALLTIYIRCTTAIINWTKT